MKASLSLKVLLISALTILTLIACNVLYPNAPEQLTMITQDQQTSLSTCPQLMPLPSTQITENKITKLKQTFTLLNWNIYKQQNQRWSEKLSEWTKQADIITLQEVKYTKALRHFIKQHKLFSIQNIAFIYQDNIYGVNSISRALPQQACGTRYSEPWIRVPKSAIATTYAIQGSNQRLLSVNLHSVNFTFTSKPLQHQLAPYLQLIAQHQGPIIVSGDLNTWTSSKTDTISQSLTNMGLREVSFSPDNRKTAFGYPLDYVFYKELSVYTAKSIATEASDHTPQLVTFSLIKR